MGNTQTNNNKNDNRSDIAKQIVSQHRFTGIDNLSNNNDNLSKIKHTLRYLYKNNFVSLTFVYIND
jgi:hypothetical protein